MYRLLSRLVLTASVLFSLIPLHRMNAEVPRLINYQGSLSDSLGSLLDTTLTMTFTLYADSAGVTSLWSESHSSVSVRKGAFDVILGSLTAFPQSIFDGSVRWLRIQIDGGPLSQPPIKIVSVAYAFKSQMADTASYAVSGGSGGSGGGWTDDGSVVRLTDPTDRVGVGLNNPNRHLYILEQKDGLAFPFKLDNPNPNIANGVGILFSTGGNAIGQPDTARGKGALVYEHRGDYWNRGKFHFLQNRLPSPDIPTLSDAVMTIEYGGNVGIGASSPARRLDVGGCLRVKGADGWVSDMGNGIDISYNPGAHMGQIETVEGASFGNLYLGRGKVGINNISPAEQLDVNGTVKMTGLKLTASPAAGYVLTSDASGTATWQPAGLSLPYSGTLSTAAVAFSVTASNAGGFAIRGWNTPKDNRGILGGDTAGVYGYNGYSNSGVFGESYSGKGVYGKTLSGNYGWLGSDAYGAYGYHHNTGNYGALGSNNGGVYGVSSTGFAGYFNGKAYFSNNVGIGTTDPDSKLHIYHPSGGFIIADAGSNQLNGLVVREADSTRWILFFRGWQSNNLIVRDEPGLRDVMTFQAGTGRVGVGTSSPEEVLHVAGNVKCTIMKITGADVAEPFGVTGSSTPEPGMVVTIDPENPGKLQLSSAAYDRRVAGIISGAGGISPGVIMAQAQQQSSEDFPVALSGRVYCWADASTEPIQPGDLLTTSDTPGHAMRVADYGRAQGAILGKAMSSLKEGKGLVLVLVSLQ